MALFGRGDKPAPAPGKPQEDLRPLVGREVYCRVCDAARMFTRCWRRGSVMRQCPCCGLVFENPAVPYKLFAPACPKCAEPLEQPGFDYGICDGCGSKYEIVEGTKPGLLPNFQQRKDMDRHGKAKAPKR